MIKKELNLKLKRYDGATNKLHMYRSLEDDELGINYLSFLKIRYETFNKNHILQKYSIDGWRILCYLITKAKDYKYIMITPNIIQKELNIKTKSGLFKSLNNLFASGVIYGNINKKLYSSKNNIKGLNDLMDIIITYADDDYYTYKSDIQGYKPIPLDLVSIMVKDLTSEEWATYCLLMVRHRYYNINDVIDKDTGEIHSYINEYFYAFPPQENIAMLLGCERKKINKITKSLEKKGYIELEIPKGANKLPKKKKDTYGNIITTRTCTKYKIKLMKRVEYIYYYILLLEDNKHEKEAKKIGIGKYISKLKESGRIHSITDKIFLLNSSIAPELNAYIKSKTKK